MKSTIRNLIFGAAALVAAFAAVPQAFAAQMMLCAPDAVATATGGRRVVNPNTNNAYALNSAGCAIIQQADLGYFYSQGYTNGSSEGAIIYTTGVASGTTDFVIGSVPAGMYITEIVYSNAVADAIPSGISIRTPPTSTPVVAAQDGGSSLRRA